MDWGTYRGLQLPQFFLIVPITPGYRSIADDPPNGSLDAVRAIQHFRGSISCSQTA
jgi:hypothetical protein